MKTIIIYDTKHGTTLKISELIAIELGKKETEIVHIKKIKDYNLRIFDTIIIGGSIHGGQIQTSIKKFCKENLELLKEKKTGLFITSMIDDEEKQKEQFKNAFTEELISISKAQGILGGEFLFEKMSFIEKLMVKIIAKTSKTKTNIKKEEIKKFVKQLKK